jgi:hypothetical protein
MQRSIDSARLLKRAATESGKLVPSAGSLLTFLLDILLHSKESRQRTQTLHLTEQEHEILFRLQHLAGRKHLLLMADDVQYWDQDSLRLLLMLLGPRLSAVYPFLKQMHVIAAVTRDWKLEHEDVWQQVLLSLRKNEWHLESVQKDGLPALLAAFGLKVDPGEDQLALLYGVSGGHLEVLRQLAEYYACDPNKHWNLLTGAGTPALDLYEVLQRYVKERLENLGVEGTKTLNVLGAASIIGRAFTSPELRCILGQDARQVSEALDSAERLHLVKRENSIIRFSHEALRECLLKATAYHAPELHEAFAKCLAILRPSDFLTRAEHLLLGGQEDLATQLYFIALLRQIRDCEPTANDLRERVCGMMNRFGRAEFCSTIIEAYTLFFKQRYAEAATLLGNAETIASDILLAERDYLLALCLLKRFNSADNLKAVALLKEWDILKDQEPGIWCRIQMTLLVALARVNDTPSAKGVERSVGRYYDVIRRSDPYAEVAINILRRKAANLYGAEVAAERCRLAVSYFQPVDETTASRNPAQYYMALCNLAGNLIVIGEFEEAREKAQAACAFGKRCRSTQLPRLEVGVNNLVLSGYLCGKLKPSEAVAAMQEMRPLLSESPDKLLATNNLVLLEALSGDLRGALGNAKQLLDDLIASSSDDTYYRYWIETNLASLLHLNGMTDAALKLWGDINVPVTPEGDRQFLLTRQERQSEAFRTIKPGDAEGWDTFLSKKYPGLLGPPWRFFGRGFLFSDIQFWSES